MDENLPKKSLGQHWLFDEIILDDICDFAEINDQDIVLEIGPGLGTLTERLVNRAKQVIAVEFDKQLVAKLEQKYSKLIGSELSVESSDIRTYNLTKLPKNYKVVANIPYYLTSNLVRILSETSNPPSSTTLLIQKEVAERICADPGEMSLLSVSAQLYHDCSLGTLVPAEYFTPPPKVDSQVVKLVRKSEQINADDAKKILRLAKAGFSGRRKTLLNSLSAGLAQSKDETKELLEASGIDPGLRAQNLSLDQWKTLAKNIRT